MSQPSNSKKSVAICCLGHANTKNCFIEAMQLIEYCLKLQGKSCQIVNSLENRPQTIWIVFGVNISPTVKLPPETIIVNMEQLYDKSGWLNTNYLNQLRTHRIWDYNRVNQAYLRKIGLDASLISYGYIPSFRHTGTCWADASDKPVLNQNIDVLMLGYPNGNRNALAQKLRQAGVKIDYRNGNTWGSQRNDLMVRSKILLNVHLYPAAILEIPRLSLAINNGMFIISESCCNQAEYPWMQGCVIFKPYSELLSTVLESVMGNALRWWMK
jgi:hypothetical protein